ncbi:MazG-like pyrophosphatase [Idiomarinaceae phage 1N2-2]|uniref:MazG-like pyrophosphatase n=1 Tax=Idiomarinaceae phage 1N2-2 TaxID=1536592 RepID=UPI0004F74B2A|nr:MazG-like pyrophosphatase [Idiomarinaceae phage 1N2-2]AIM40758.1 putative NTP-PPase transcriptional repressor [Idiomarinaceae phage 1N2-2]
MQDLIEKITQWHHDRNLIDGSTDLAQFAKLVSEVGELGDGIGNGEDLSDHIGDIIVVLVNIAERNGLSIDQCLATAWEDIKGRRGRMSDAGVFVKDLPVGE